jgi:succinate dehydrogenase/fumarate reductase flavoprotein subunit
MIDTPLAVGFVVDDTCDTTDWLAVAVCHVQNIFAHLKSRVLLWVEDVELVQDERWTEILAVFVEVVAKLDEAKDIKLAGYLFDLYSHCVALKK